MVLNTKKRCKKMLKSEISKKIKALNKTFKRYKLKSLSNKHKKSVKRKFDSVLCNPNCSGTLFENGNPNKLSVKAIEKIKEPAHGNKKLEKALIKLALESRKELFGKNKSILDKDSFYKKTKKNYKKKMKNKGALSYCGKFELSKL